MCVVSRSWEQGGPTGAARYSPFTRADDVHSYRHTAPRPAAVVASARVNPEKESRTMSDDDTERAVSAHYSRGDLLATIEAALRGRGLDPAHLTAEQLAPLDNFHSFGVAGTLQLLRLAYIRPSAPVFDGG